MLEKFLTLGSLPLIIAALLLAGIGVPIPEDPLLLAGGVITHRTSNEWWLVFPLLYVSALAADSALYAMARHFGEPMLQRRPFRWMVNPARRERVSHLFRKHGPKAVFFGRHLAGLRALVFMLAGIEKMRFASFLAWDALAALVTIPLIYSLGYLFSSHVQAVEQGLAHAEHWLAAAAGAVALIVWVVWRRQPESVQDLDGTDDGQGSAQQRKPVE